MVQGRGSVTPEERDASEREERRMRISRKGIKDPLYRRLGMEVTGIGEGWATLSMPVDRGILSSEDTINGGVICAMADAVSGLALLTLLDDAEEKPVNVEMKINFCAPPFGGSLSARGEVVQRGSRVAVCEAEIRDDRDSLIAKGNSTFKVNRGDYRRPSS